MYSIYTGYPNILACHYILTNNVASISKKGVKHKNVLKFGLKSATWEFEILSGFCNPCILPCIYTGYPNILACHYTLTNNMASISKNGVKHKNVLEFGLKVQRGNLRFFQDSAIRDFTL